MASISETVTTTVVQPSQTKDIATRLLNGTLHAGYPPIEQFMTIDGLLKSHAAQPDEKQRPLICYPASGAADFEKHTAGDLDRYTDAAVHYYIEQGLPPAVRLLRLLLTPVLTVS
jgi:hypothetical protein